MAPTKPKQTSPTRTKRGKADAFATQNADAEANTKYESGLIPLLWLAIPLALVMLYGFLN